MQDYKNNKILELIKEMVKVPNQTDYEINGVDTSRAIYFYRKEKEKFKIIPRGSYSVVDVASNKYLRITDTSLLGEAIEFQVCYLFIKTSSSYVDEFPEITLLQGHYNQLYDDFNNLLNQLKSNNILGDTLKMSYVLPQLNEGQVWVLRQGEMKAENIFDLDERLKEAFEQFKVIFSKWIDEVEKPRFESFVDEKIISASDELDGKTELEKIELEDYTEQKKNELDIYLTGRKPIQYATISELQASSNLEVGDYVEVAGYYTVGDGANHKRVISNEDDGSGVQLANGFWANIVHNGEVSVNWFGAKGDGVTDDTLSIRKTANFNSKAVTVLGNKNYLISDTLTFNNDNFQFKGIKGNNTKLTYRFQNKPAILISGGSGKPLMKDIVGIEFEGTETTTGIEIRGACGVFPRKCEFKTNRYGVKFSNDVRVGTFSEGNIAYNCRFYSSCKTSIYYFKGVGDRSFHGSGLWDCWVDTQASNSMIEISSEALPYNAPLNFRCLSTTQTLINNQGSSDVNFYGNINIEGEVPILASGNRVLFVGTINGHGKFLNGTLVEVEKMHTSGGAGENVTKIKRKKSITKITLQSGIRKELFIRKGKVILNIGDYSHDFCVCRASNGGNTKICTPINTNSKANFEQLGVSFGDSKIIFAPSINGNLYVTLEYDYDIASKDEVIGYEI